MCSFIKGSSFLFDHVYVTSCATVAGPMEKRGPLQGYFDQCFDDLYCGEKSFELAERRMAKRAVLHCLEKANQKMDDIDIYLGGDLLNQIVTSNYLARDFMRPFLGMYGACSTSALTLGTASCLVEGGLVNQALAFTSSHNATAERQYRYPVEYGIQKCETTTFTATGAAAIIVSNQKSDIRVEAVTFGRVIDLEQKDPNDMGKAMAPAAYDTLKTHFKDLNRSFEDYDLIVTGDLSKYGKQILTAMFEEEGQKVTHYDDCGCLLYHESQPIFQGGSGCACSALVTYGYLLEQLRQGKYHRILLVATGALLSPVMTMQKETIPCIAHAISLEAVTS